MKTRTVIVSVIVMTFFITIILAMLFNVAAVADVADEIRISSIEDSYIGKEVTVSGVIITISSNIEPSTSTEVGIQTYEPGDTGVLTIDDGTDTIFVSSDPRLLEKIYKGQSITVTGIYAGKSGIEEDKGIIYADKVSADIEHGYKDVTVKELEDFPEYYYDDSVRIKGIVIRIEIMSGETGLEIDDGTGTMDVEYRAEMGDIKIGDEVIAEGKFYRNKIYAFAVKAKRPEPEESPGPSPSPSPSPAPSPTPTPTPTNETTPTPSPTPKEAGGIFHLSPYLIVIIIAVVAVAGVFIAFKVRDWLLIRRYGK